MATAFSQRDLSQQKTATAAQLAHYNEKILRRRAHNSAQPRKPHSQHNNFNLGFSNRLRGLFWPRLLLMNGISYHRTQIYLVRYLRRDLRVLRSSPSPPSTTTTVPNTHGSWQTHGSTGREEICSGPTTNIREDTDTHKYNTHAHAIVSITINSQSIECVALHREPNEM